MTEPDVVTAAQRELGDVAKALGLLGVRLSRVERDMLKPAGALAYWLQATAIEARIAAEDHARALATVATYSPADAEALGQRSPGRPPGPGRLVLGPAEAAMLRAAAEAVRDFRAAASASSAPRLLDGMDRVAGVLELLANAVAPAGTAPIAARPVARTSIAGEDPS